MATAQFANPIIKDAYEKLRSEIATDIQMQLKQKPETIKPEPTDGETTKIKQEPIDETTVVDTKPSLDEIEAKIAEKLPFTDADLLARPYAFAQVAFKKRQELRRQLIDVSIGSCSRALSARQDLKIRRRLCGLPEEELIERATVVVPNLNATPPVVEPAVGTADGEVDDGPVKPQSSISLAFQMFKRATERVC